MKTQISVIFLYFSALIICKLPDTLSPGYWLERDDLFVQVVYRDVNVMIALSLLCDFSEVDGFLRTVLYTCAARNALVTEDYCISDISDVSHRADFGACSALYALA